MAHAYGKKRFDNPDIVAVIKDMQTVISPRS